MFDVAMAISVLLSLGELEVKIENSTGFIGALSLYGEVVPVEGMLPAVLAAKRLGLKRLYRPFDERLPPLQFDGLDIVYVSSLMKSFSISTDKRFFHFFRSLRKRKINPPSLTFHKL